jgi:hypothetical protein
VREMVKRELPTEGYELRRWHHPLGLLLLLC